MDKKILLDLFQNSKIDSGAIQKLGVSSYTYQETIKTLTWLGVITEAGSKLKVKTLDNQISTLLKKIVFDGFDASILKKENIKWLSKFLSPKTLSEVSSKTNLSIAQTARKVKKFSQFLSKEKKHYSLSNANKDFYELIKIISEKENNKYFWTNGKAHLQKIPINFSNEGTLTGFSRFSENGVVITSTHQFIYFPKKELSLEEILIHAIKFSNNANDLTLCILFYLKNKHKLNIKTIENECKKFEVLDVWMDVVYYLEDQPVKNKELFLPKNEFKQKENLYDVSTPKRYEQEQIQKLFEEIEKKLTTPINIYFIGGNALIEHKTKNSTKDIDLVMVSSTETRELIKTLKELDFNEIAHKEFQYGQLETSAMLEKNNYPRIDLFLNKICGMLEFSKNMQKRSKQIRKGKVNIFVASLEDVFLLKSISSRDSDLVDCENILRQARINWDVIIEELIKQQKNMGGFKELIVLEHFEALEKRMNIIIPIIKKLTNICLEKSILFLAKQPLTIKEIKNKISFSETLLRNKITKMKKEGLIIKTNDKPFKIKLKQ